MSDMIYDRASEMKLTGVHPELALRWRKVCKDFFDLHQLQLKVTDGLRTFSQQWAEWSKGRLKDKNGQWIVCDERKVVTHAMPGQSYHQYGLAVDSAFLGNDPYLANLPEEQSIFLWNEYGRICVANGLEWGGNWPHPKTDRPHCEKTFGFSVHDLQIMYEDKGLRGIWTICTQKTGGLTNKVPH